jgi:hypothetical protein
LQVATFYLSYNMAMQLPIPTWSFEPQAPTWPFQHLADLRPPTLTGWAIVGDI